MKSIKEITDDVIDLVHENTYSEIEEDHDEDGHHVQVNLSPQPSCYEKLNAYMLNLHVETIIEVFVNQQKSKASGR